MNRRGALAEVCAVFLRLGLSSFGGPVAHLGFIRAECVEARGWLDDAAFADLVALCQFLPGPSSSQVVYALGMQRAGLLGALGASGCFLLPSAALMIAFAYGVAALGTLRAAGGLHGLQLAAVAVVAQAVWSMGRALCPDGPRLRLCLLAAAGSLLLRMPAAPVLVLAVGAAVGLWQARGASRSRPDEPAADGRARAWALAALAVCAALLVLPRLLGSATGSRTVAVFDAFYRAGALVFGGGHVVLPLLRSAVVARGWVRDDAFLAGYGAAQAVPGPLFSFAGYLGTIIAGGGRWGWLGGVGCLVAIFLPSWLLVAGAWPFWHRLRAAPRVQAALKGANAAVVGVLLAALYDPVFTESVRGAADAAVALVAFGLLTAWSVPPWLVVLLSAAVGQWVLA